MKIHSYLTLEGPLANQDKFSFIVWTSVKQLLHNDENKASLEPAY